MPGLRAWHSGVLRALGIGIRIVGATVAVLVGATASPAGAAVAITAPTSANLGSAATGTSTLSAQLGTVTATASAVLLVGPSFTATVSATAFKTGGGSASETIAKASIRYWSGPATSVSGGLLSGFTPSQANAAQAVDLSVPRIAFSGSAPAGTISASWNPTIVVNIPASAVAGTYSGTITHSVA